MNLYELISNSQIIFSNKEIAVSIDKMAQILNKTYRNQRVVVLPVLSGAIPFAGHLIPKLTFEVVVNYFHASRYAENIGTDNIKLIYEPLDEIIANQTVLVLDDILDQGDTLKFIKHRLLRKGAAAVATAVLFDKAIDKNKSIQADYIGLNVPDVFVYGFGLDFNGIGRNMADLHAYNNK